MTAPVTLSEAAVILSAAAVILSAAKDLGVSRIILSEALALSEANGKDLP